MADRIYLSAPHMGPNEERYVHDAFATNWLSSVGPNLDAFEQALGELSGGHAVALASGTAAVHLALRALGVADGDEIFCSTLTFAGSCNPIVYERAVPVFLDSDTSYNLDPNVLEDALKQSDVRGKRPKAIIAVHLYGQPLDLDAIFALGHRFGVPVIEDAAEALGTLYWGKRPRSEGKQVGALGELGIYSFNGNKIITTTGGGAFVSQNKAQADKVRFWSTQARDPGISYEHSELGFNYRMSNVLAGIGRGQLEVLPDRVAARRRVASRYQEMLADIEELSLMPEVPYGLHTYWLSVFALAKNSRVSRDQLIAALSEHNIESRPVWKPMHLQRFFADARAVGGATAESLFLNGICLPSSSFLTDADLLRVVNAIRNAFGKANHA